MKRIASMGAMLILLLTTVTVILAQGQFFLGQTSAVSGGVSSGGSYTVSDAIEPGCGVASSGIYQVISCMALGSGSQPAVTFTLNFTTNGNGIVTLNPPGGVYAAGTIVQLTAVPASGFNFAGWTGAVSGIANPINVTMDGDKTVTVTFTESSEVKHVYLPMIRN